MTNWSCLTLRRCGKRRSAENSPFGLTEYTRNPCCANRSRISTSEVPCSSCSSMWPRSSAILIVYSAIVKKFLGGSEGSLALSNQQLALTSGPMLRVWPPPHGLLTLGFAKCQGLTAKCLFHELRSRHHLHASWRREAKLLVWYFDVFPLLKEAEFGHRAVEFFDDHARDQPIRRHFQQGLRHSLTHSFGNAS